MVVVTVEGDVRALVGGDGGEGESSGGWRWSGHEDHDGGGGEE